MSSSRRISRRHVLRGLGGAALSLPFLTSLWPRESRGQVPNQRCFAAFQIGHGGYWASDIVGELLGSIDDPPASLTRELWIPGGTDQESGLAFADHHIHHGNLADYLQTAAQAGDPEDPDGGRERLSFALGSRANGLLGKMSILRGICLPVKSFGHQSCVTLGMFGRSQNGPSYPTAASVDHIMSESPAFYGTLDGVSRRAVRVGTMSTDRYGQTIEEFHSKDMRTTEFFDAVFNGEQSSDATQGNTLLVDRVLDDYHRFLSPASRTGSRISRYDRDTVNQVVEHLSEIQRRAQAVVSCGDPERPEDIWRYPGWPGETYFPIITDIIALGFACGATRVGTFNFDGRWIGNSCGCADYHQDIAHQLSSRANAVVHRRGLRRFLDLLVLPLAEKLDQYAGSEPGTTKLDDSLLCVTPESGFWTHHFKDDTIVTLGGAGGRLTTGKYIDYRNHLSGAYGNLDEARRTKPGALRNTFLSTTLEAMGVDRSEWQDEATFGTKAYAGHVVDRTSKTDNEISHSTNPGAHADQIHLPVWWRG